ncbi:MAG: DNA-directed DNA polymerase [Candidatus Parcubacteria bacterium]|nr:MAG: DNA-directed DNA polymerase [Candidatus Parcubacteria bacterium]
MQPDVRAIVGDMAHGWTPLNVHSHYSLLKALPTIPDIVHQAKTLGYDAIALTDAGALYGAIEFYKAARAANIRPIVGVDAYVAPRTRHDMDAVIDRSRERLILLARTTEGYRNLIRLVTRSYTEGFYYTPRVDADLLKEHAQGLIALMPANAGKAAQQLRNGNREGALAALRELKEVFGEHAYAQVTLHPEAEMHDALMGELVEAAREVGVPVVADREVYYLTPQDVEAYATLLKVQQGAYDPTTPPEDFDLSLPSAETMEMLYRDLPEALANARRVADMSEIDIPIGEWKFPQFPLPKGVTPQQELERLAWKGVAWRGLDPNNPKVKQRLSYELSVIEKKGYATYFLVVGDLLREARSRGIYTTIRGSVAGSLTTYVLGITNVDPLSFQLPFERFLNPERPSAPDIDMDFQDNRRDEIIEYAREKYGKDKVAQIGTFGTMLARASVRDVARALGYPYAMGDKIARLIPMGRQGFPVDITKAMELEPDLAKLYKENADARRIIDLARKIEGKARHISVHAAGVVISPDPLTDHVPLQFDPKGTGKLITQYEMRSVGEDGVGLLKFDFLGIRNLSILADAVARVERNRGVRINIEHIPFDDQKTFEMLARGETMGLFQLNGSGMTQFLQELKPTTIHDINAMVALYRPGPMESIPQYIARKHNPYLVHYLDDRLRPILERSFGVIVYQDDVMMIAIELAGYSWLEADKLRKAMGKKIPEVMAEEKEKLLQGLTTHGMSQDKAQELWALIEPFAAYGFNKAHAASYGRVAYQTAYMKANYPEEYMAAVLTAESGDTEEIAKLIAECKRIGITVAPPHVNFSDVYFSEVPGKREIRFGLLSIKNFGESVAKEIVADREAHGSFSSLEDFLARANPASLNRRALEALILSGALDNLGYAREQMLAHIERLLAYTREIHAGEQAQQSLFSAPDETHPPLGLPPTPPLPLRERLAQEKLLLGVYVSGHPLDEYRDLMGRRKITNRGIKERVPVDVTATAAGVVVELREVYSKRGEKMAFALLEDNEDRIEIALFPETYRTYREIVTPGACLAVEGRVTRRNDEKSIVAERIQTLDEVRNKLKGRPAVSAASAPAQAH